jgi:hypothetical protein
MSDGSLDPKHLMQMFEYLPILRYDLAPQRCRVILIAAYTIGKEKIFLEAARRCQMPICVTAAKKAILDLLDWSDCDMPLEDVFTCDPSKTILHAVKWNYIGEAWPFFRPNYTNMEWFAGMCAPAARRSCRGFLHVTIENLLLKFVSNRSLDSS